MKQKEIGILEIAKRIKDEDRARDEEMQEEILRDIALEEEKKS